MRASGVGVALDSGGRNTAGPNNWAVASTGYQADAITEHVGRNEYHLQEQKQLGDCHPLGCDNGGVSKLAIHV